MAIGANVQAWLFQVSAPLSVRYGDELQFAGQDLPRPEKHLFPTRHGSVRGYLYRAPGQAQPPVYVHFHGGAFLMRYPAMDDFFCRFVAATAGVAVLNVDYSVAPQARYPVAQEQAHDVATWLAAYGDRIGLDSDRLAVGGFSAGGNLAASACLQARDLDSFVARFQLLAVPSLDLTTGFEEKAADGRSSMISKHVVDLVQATYFRDAERRAEPYASPVHARDLSGLPPAMLVTAEHDLLRGEGDAYAEALRSAGVPVEHRTVPGRDHYFLNGSPEHARGEMNRMAEAIGHHLTN